MLPGVLREGLEASSGYGQAVLEHLQTGSPAVSRLADVVLKSARDVIARRAGVLVVEHAPLSLKQQTDVFGPLRGDFPIMKRLRAEFDAERTLSPGRFVGRL